MIDIPQFHIETHISTVLYGCEYFSSSDTKMLVVLSNCLYICLGWQLLFNPFIGMENIVFER